ncbi:MAG TPA: PrsW family glutamic-type intramembrane protease [Anaerolineaceae bacterium]|nr:PrsW family glutamic-type intramembrane protease [Anaerolineaceae bacterium]HPN54033.1 PrsW family glutamic-type intramembrane protease [Anaerolineaceae bacterium]
MANVTAGSKPNTDWASISLMIVSGLGALLFFGVALLMGSLSIFGRIYPPTGDADPTVMGMLAWGAGLMGAVLVPGFLAALMRLTGWHLPGWLNFGRRLALGLAPLGIILWVVVLLLGNAFSKDAFWGWALLPPLNALAVALPIFFLVFLALRGLNGSRTRRWGWWTFGLTVSPLVIIIIEAFFLGAAMILAMVAFMSDPSLEWFWMDMQSGTPSTSSAQQLIMTLEPYFQRPEVVFWVIALLAGFVPLLEEALKPMGLWLMAGRKLTPQEGFAAGILSGAGFALAESLGAVSNVAHEGWINLAFMRGGTDLLHIVCSGLIGWALVATWNDGKNLRLALTYLLAAGLHMAWNAASLLEAFYADWTVIPSVTVPVFSMMILEILVMGMMVILLFMNWYLRKEMKWIL